MKMTKKLYAIMTKEDEGFSYIETLVCIAVILLLTVVVGVSSIKIIDSAKETKCEKEIATFKQALEHYYTACGSFP